MFFVVVMLRDVVVLQEDDISLLQLCIRHQNVGMLQFLLEHGCQPNSISAGATPLMHVIETDAVTTNRAEAELQIQHETLAMRGGGGGGGGEALSPTSTSSSHCSSISSSLRAALCYHQHRTHVEVAKFSIGVSPSESLSSSSSLFEQMFSLLVQAGADVNAVTAHGSVLHCSVETLG